MKVIRHYLCALGIKVGMRGHTGGPKGWGSFKYIAGPPKTRDAVTRKFWGTLGGAISNLLGCCQGAEVLTNHFSETPLTTIDPRWGNFSKFLNSRPVSVFLETRRCLVLEGAC